MGTCLEQRATNLIARAAITSNASIIEQARSVGITGPDKPKIIRNYTLFGSGHCGRHRTAAAVSF